MFEALAIGPLLFWVHLAFLLLGIWLATEFFIRLSESANLSLQHFRDRAWQYLAAFVLFGRLFAIVAQFRVYLRDPLRVFILWDGEFSFIGAACGIGVVLYMATLRHRSTFLQWLDVLVPATVFGAAFDWFGKFMAGHAYGKPTDLPWAVTYDTIGVRYTVPVHPVQLYYALYFFLVTFLLLIVRQRSSRAGTETFFGIFLMALGTFLFEYFRGDFAIPVFATRMDFVVLLLLFLSLGIFTAVELRLTRRALVLYEAALLVFFGGYLVVRSWLEFATVELRFSQFLAILGFLATVVYVAVQRRKHPHL